MKDEGYITVEQLMRVGISDRAIAVQALVAMGVEVKEQDEEYITFSYNHNL